MRDQDDITVKDESDELVADDFIDIEEVCEMIGGKRKPVDPATVYRNIQRKIFPPPEHPSPGISRWRRNEVRASLARKVIEEGA